MRNKEHIYMNSCPEKNTYSC